VFRFGLGLAVVGFLILTGVGCGSGTSSAAKTEQARVSQHARRQAAERRAIRHHRSEVRARRAAARARARRAKAQLIRTEEAEARQQAATEEAETPEESAEGCDPNYSGACLNPYSSDYDCEGGSGNGPDYTGTVAVVDEDHFGLDADGDGVGCEVE
jgi:hypothetical protein